MTRLSILVAALLLAPACGGGDSQKGSETPASSATAAADDGSEAAASSDEADAPAAALPAPGGRQVLPAEMTDEEVNGAMKMISNSLGVMCDHCHIDNDMASDENPMKPKARAMMIMTMSMNQEYFGGEMVVSCNTCHQGQEHPPE